MIHKKIFSGRIDSASNGSELTYELDAAPGGRACKVVLYSLKVIQSSGNVVRLSIDLQTGPDGDVFGPIRAILTDWQSGTTMPTVNEGASGTPDTDASDVLGEWLRVSLKIKDAQTTAAQWAMVELWETRKPF
jgi:hypothetical protein